MAVWGCRGEGRFAVRVCYRNKYSMLYAGCEEEYWAWVEAFTKVMTRRDFHARYSVSRMIGSGGFANVYKATEIVSGKRVAVKGFNKKYIGNNHKGKMNLLQEISMMRGLSNENILKLKEMNETKNSLYLVFDLIEGGDLNDLIEKNKEGLDESEIVNIMQGLLRGLKYMSEEGVAHRDLKPANIMFKKTIGIVPEGVVIVDFGLAASLSDTNPIFKRCGTPGYIAPEVIAINTSSEEPFKILEKMRYF